MNIVCQLLHELPAIAKAIDTQHTLTAPDKPAKVHCGLSSMHLPLEAKLKRKLYEVFMS